jgi:FkbM family methyltransferase
MKWPERLSNDQLPMLYRLWASYLRHAPARPKGGVFGGSALFSLLTARRRVRAVTHESLLTLWNRDVPYGLTIDLVDFESFNHTIDLWLCGCDESRLIQALIGPERVFFDVGANLGVFSLGAAWSSGNSSDVHAFEPQPRAAAALRESVRVNALSNLFVHEFAVSNEDSHHAAFYVPRVSSGLGSFSKQHASQTGHAAEIFCPSVRLDSFLSSSSLSTVDLIKIDVEGYESLVLEGAARTLRECLPIVWFEVNPSALQRAAIPQSRAFTLMESYGYTDFYDVGRLMNGDSARAEPPFQHLVNVIAVAPLRREWLRSSLQPYVALPEIGDPEGVRN